MSQSTTRQFTMVNLFNLVALSLLVGRRVITLTDFTEYLMLETTSTKSLSLRSLALRSDICFVEAGQVDPEHVRDLRDLGIGPSHVQEIDGGLIAAILLDPEKVVLKQIAKRLEQGRFAPPLSPYP